MYNYFMLIGRICNDFKISETKDGKVYTRLSLAVQKPFKNPDTNTFDTDFLNLTLWDALCDSAINYLKKGSLIAVKGRLISRKLDVGKENSIQICEPTVEKLMFLSSEQKVNES